MPGEKPYSYFDTPGGKDVFNKFMCVMKPTSQWAFGICLFDLIVSKPKGYLPTIGRVAYVATPIFGSTTAFVLVTNTAASLRHKDDKLNWFIGGMAAGSVFGGWVRNGMLGFNVGMALGLAAVIRKYFHEIGHVMFPVGPTRTMSTSYQDWTLIKERPRNWTTGQ